MLKLAIVGNGVLHAARALAHHDRVAYSLDADFVDGKPARVLGILHVGDGYGIAGIHERTLLADNRGENAALALLDQF